MTPTRRGALTWVGTICLLAALTLAFFWTEFQPSSTPQPSTLIPAANPPTATPPRTPVATPTAMPPPAPVLTPTDMPTSAPVATPTEAPPTSSGIPTDPSTRPSAPGSNHSSLGPPRVPNNGPPARPASATGPTASAAATFAGTYFTEAINYAKTSGDVSAVRAWSDTSCKLCRQNMTVFSTSNQANGLLTGDPHWRHPQVTQVQLTDPTTATVDLSISIGQHTYRPSPGAQPISLPAQTIDLHVTLTAVAGNWVMFDWERWQ